MVSLDCDLENTADCLSVMEILRVTAMSLYSNFSVDLPHQLSGNW